MRPARGLVLPSLERLAPPPPENQIAIELEARTAPGDVVVELHGRGGWVARSAVNRLRRAYDFESTALTRLVADVVLRPPDLRHLDAAIEGLAVQPRGDLSLRDALQAPFASRCATCGRGVIVDEFTWDGDAPVPFRKVYRCPFCRDQGRGGENRSGPLDAEDRRLAERPMSSGPRQALRTRFPTPHAGEDFELPEQLLDLYTPRTLAAIGALVERLDGDLRAAPIRAALRLSLLHVLLPASRLNSYPGRMASLRVTSGRLRRLGARQWRERNPWRLFEEGCRHVRSFIQRLEGAPGGTIQARLGEDLRSLVDGSANVVIRTGSANRSQHAHGLPRDRPVVPDSVDPLHPVRLVLTQPPLRWSNENLAFAYLATSIVLGPEAAAGLPLEGLFGPPPAGEWGLDAAAFHRGLRAVRPILAPDADVVLLLEQGPPAALVAGVLGGVGAGYRLSDALLTEAGESIGGTVEFTHGADRPGAGGAHGEAMPAAGFDEPLDLAEVDRAVSDLAAGVLAARGEPASFGRLLGEVLIGLDRTGHLRRLIGPRTFAATEAQAAPAAGAVPTRGPTSNGHRPAEPLPLASVRAAGASPAGIRSVARLAAAPAAEERRTETVAIATSAGPAAGTTDLTGSRRGTATADEPDTSGPDLTAEGRPSGADGTGAETLAAGERVRLLLEIVLDELRREDHPRLVEIEPGRWWLRNPSDIAAARLPLADRLEWSVFSLLSTSRGISEEAFFQRIASMFARHDTPDDELVRSCLESYRAPDAPADALSTNDDLVARYEEHGTLIGMLAEYGHRLGLRCWIGRREQRRRYGNGVLGDLLTDLEQRAYLPLVAPGSADALDSTDCIWYLRGHKATFLFEVEWTAMIAEALLRRGPRIDTTDTTVRFLVIVPERTELVRLKIARSPLLRAAMDEGNWHILKANHLRRLHEAEGADLARLGTLLGLDPEIEQAGEQLPLFR